MLKINDLTQLYLGIQGENKSRTIVIDVADWLVSYPNGSLTIWIRRPGYATATATGAVFDAEEKTLTWQPDSVDTYVAGEGTAEIRLTEGTVIKKTREIRIAVSPAVTGGGTTLGSDWQSYINEVERIKGNAVAAANTAGTAAEAAGTAAEAAEAATVHTPYINMTNYHWMIWDIEQGIYVDSGFSSQGTQGETGTGIDHTTLNADYTLTIYYTDGTSVTTVSIRGEKGEQGEQGEKGEPGDPPVIASQIIEYQESESGTVIPEGTWSTTIPPVAQGNFLWTRITLTWDDEENTQSVSYSVSRMGIDGSGSVSAAVMNGQAINPDGSGVLNLGNVIREHQDISGKADKVSNATNGDVATLDGNGNLTGSGKTLGISIPTPASGDSEKFLKGDGTWAVAANPPTTLSLTAAAGSWSSATPQTQTITAIGVTASNTIIVSLASTATQAQYEAAAGAGLLCTAQGADTVTLTAFGGAPSENIPISVLILS